MHICRRQGSCWCNACMWAFSWLEQVELSGTREVLCRYEVEGFFRTLLAGRSDVEELVESKLVARMY